MPQGSELCPLFRSNRGMENLPLADNTDQRLTELEIKASFSEDLLDELNQVIVRQQTQIANSFEK